MGEYAETEAFQIVRWFPRGLAGRFGLFAALEEGIRNGDRPQLRRESAELGPGASSATTQIAGALAK